jgi:ATP-dependent helicase/nuclease subunit A
MHRLLQFLPQQPKSARSAATQRFLAVAARDVAEESREAMAREAMAVLDHPALAPLFAPESRAETAFAARLPEAAEMTGRIDRLAVTEDAVWIADFKTDRVPPGSTADAPAAYVRQLAHYRAAIQRILPGRPVRALLVFTAGPVVLEVEAARLDAAITWE